MGLSVGNVGCTRTVPRVAWTQSSRGSLPRLSRRVLPLLALPLVSGCLADPFLNYPHRAEELAVDPMQPDSPAFRIRGRYSLKEIGEVRAALKLLHPRVLQFLTSSIQAGAARENPLELVFADNLSFGRQAGISPHRCYALYNQNGNVAFYRSFDSGWENHSRLHLILHEIMHALDDRLVHYLDPSWQEIGMFTEHCVGRVLYQHILGQAERGGGWKNPSQQALLEQAYSLYAYANPAEWFAESMTAYLLNPEHLYQIDPKGFRALHGLYQTLCGDKAFDLDAATHAFRVALADELTIGEQRVIVEGNPLPSRLEALQRGIEQRQVSPDARGRVLFVRFLDPDSFENIVQANRGPRTMEGKNDVLYIDRRAAPQAVEDYLRRLTEIAGG